MEATKLLMSLISESFCSNYSFDQPWASWEASVDWVDVRGMGVLADTGEVHASFFLACLVAAAFISYRPPFPLSYLLFPSAPWWAAPPSLCFLVAESSPHETPFQACPSQCRSPGSGLSLLIKALLTSVPWWDSGLST